MGETDGRETGRQAEWFVPWFGPAAFRSFVGLLFLPYTGMVLSFAVLGSVVAPSIDLGRLCAIVIIYALGLGVGAHSLDALGRGGKKPWGVILTKRQLIVVAAASLTSAYAVAAYYMVTAVSRLWTVAAAEGFFVFAYNLEWFKGRFHTDGWFAFSWGFLPVIAGNIMQTNTVSPAALALGLSMALFSLIEIKASRPYKELKKRAGPYAADDLSEIAAYEYILKCVSLGVMLLASAFLILRFSGGRHP